MDCCPGEERLSQAQNGYEQCLPGSRSQIWSPCPLNISDSPDWDTLPVCLRAWWRFWVQSRTGALSFVLGGTEVLTIELAFCFAECTSWHTLGNVSASSLTASAFFRCLTLIFDLASRIHTALGTCSWVMEANTRQHFFLLSLVFILKPGLPYFRLTQLPSVTNFSLACSLGMILFF